MRRERGDFRSSDYRGSGDVPVVQSALQTPSAGGSHCSGGCTMPSPQNGSGAAAGGVVVSHEHPARMEHVHHHGSR